jgi:hypothetical protein
MPPEQRRDATAVDARSDLWSLAATCYQMLTGEVPRVIDLDAVPQNLRSVFVRALKQNPDERFPTAGEFKASLRKGMATMAAPLAAELAAGVCPSCGAANDASRKFCRECRASLIEPCLSCESGNPVWEDVCGECGSSQQEQRELIRGQLATVIEESVTLAHAHEYEKALANLKAVRKDKHAFTEEIRKQAAKQIKLVKVQQKEQYQLETKEKLAAVIEESQALSRTHEYQKAQLKVKLENVPAARQDAFTEDMFEQLAQQFKLVTAQQKEQHQLRDERLKLADQYRQARDFAGVVKELEKIPAPLRTAMVPAGAYSSTDTTMVIFYQLADEVTEELEHFNLPPKQKRVMELVVGHQNPFPAQQLADEADCTQAPLKTLAKRGLLVASSQRCHPISVQLSNAIAARDELPSLMQQIRDAIKNNRIDGLLEKTTRFLELNPGDLRAQKLHKKLLQRQQQAVIQAAQQQPPLSPLASPPLTTSPAQQFTAMSGPNGLRVAAGVLIIFVAITNFMVGLNILFSVFKMPEIYVYGFYSLALSGLEIVAGVALFMGTAALLIKVTAGLEIAGFVILSAAVYPSMGIFAVGIFSVLGITAAILAFLGARAIDTAKAAVIRPPRPAP